MTVAGHCSSPLPSTRVPQCSKLNNYWSFKITGDDKIQASSSKRKYKRRGSKTAAMLIAGCCAPQQQMLLSEKDNTDSCPSEEQERLVASGPPIIAIPPLATSLTTLHLNSTSHSPEACLSDIDQQRAQANVDETTQGDETRRSPFS